MDDNDALRMLSAAQRYHVPNNHELDMDNCQDFCRKSAGDWLADDDSLHDSCEVDKSLNVAVLLSGGVDSSLALNLAVAAGHNVTAFYLQIWFQEDFRNFWDSCPWEEDLHYAQKVCDAAGVVLKVVPFTEEYWEEVVGDSVMSIRKGLTPNPDILCNSRIKFGAFHEFLEKAHAGEFDRIVSGHYARVDRPEYRKTNTGTASASPTGNKVLLAITPDEVKDQTYFLAQLSQAQIARCMFPLGSLTKAAVRKMAATAALVTKDRKDSQGICFLGKVKFSEFLREHLGEWPGLILEEETDQQLGFHQGFWFHTIGQRSGLLLADGPWYVVRKDIVLNVVYVSKHYYEDKMRKSFQCSRFNWIQGGAPDPRHGQIKCKVRHGPMMYDCCIEDHADGTSKLITLDKNDQGLAPGQYAVFYQNGICFGSGIIQSS
eukprot:jgi/Tetstr1/433436/TSEL_022710.t1